MKEWATDSRRHSKGRKLFLLGEGVGGFRNGMQETNCLWGVGPHSQEGGVGGFRSGMQETNCLWKCGAPLPGSSICTGTRTGLGI